MKTLFDEARRRQVEERLGRLTADTKPRWGKFTASRMVAHCADSLRMALGTLPTRSKRLPLRYPPLKQFVVYWMPFPKGAPTARELVDRTPGEFEREVGDVRGLIVALGNVPRDRAFPEHPAFGRLSRRAWGVLTYRHFDHHLRQFGV